MALSIRKQIKMGPVNVNLSKSGIGWSIGGKGFRRTYAASGKVKNTVSIPGTGVSYSTTGGKKPKKKKTWLWVLLAVALLLILLGGRTEPEPERAAPVVETTQAATAPTTAATTAATEPTVHTYTYVVNTQSKKFHRAGCASAKNIAPENREEITATRDEMIANGYTRCGSCTP